MTDDQTVDVLADAIHRLTAGGVAVALAQGFRAGYSTAAQYADSIEEVLRELPDELDGFMTGWTISTDGTEPTPLDRMRAAAEYLLLTLQADGDEPDSWDCMCGDNPGDPVDERYGCPRCRLERVGLV